MLNEIFYWWAISWVLYKSYNYFMAPIRLKKQNIKIGGKDIAEVDADDIMLMVKEDGGFEKHIHQVKHEANKILEENKKNKVAMLYFALSFVVDPFFAIYGILYMGWTVKISLILAGILGPVCTILGVSNQKKLSMKYFMKLTSNIDIAVIIIMLNMILMHYLS